MTSHLALFSASSWGLSDSDVMTEGCCQSLSSVSVECRCTQSVDVSLSVVFVLHFTRLSLVRLVVSRDFCEDLYVMAVRILDMWCEYFFRSLAVTLSPVVTLSRVPLVVTVDVEVGRRDDPCISALSTEKL